MIDVKLSKKKILFVCSIMDSDTESPIIIEEDHPTIDLNLVFF